MIDTGVERFTVSFRDLTPRGRMEKPKTKAELKTFPKTTLTLPVSIQLNSENNIWQPGMTSADGENKSLYESKSS
jgi:hypothetical protein